MVTASPYVCILVNPTRPGLVHSGYARVYFAHSVDVYGYIAVVALYAGRMSPRSGMVSNAGGRRLRKVNPSSNHAGPQLHHHVPGLSYVSFRVLVCES